MLPVTRRPAVAWRHVVLVTSAALALLAGLAGEAPAKTAAQAIASINELRVAHGIPPLAGDPVLSTACQLHAHYMFLNGGWDRGNAHDETRSNPGYTLRGAGAAQRSVLAATGWFAPNPWATAPVHLSQVLNPALRRTGYGQESVFICLDTVAGLTTQDADLLTYPGPNATGVPPALTAAEITPDGILTTPGVSVGIRTGTRTGPYLMLFTKSPLASVDAVSLTGPAGPVSVAVADRFLIPRAPLQSRSTYTANVSLTTADGQTIQRQWQFVTGAAVPEYSTPTLPLDVRIAARITGASSRPRLSISARGAAVGRSATFRARRVRRVCRPKCATRPVGVTTITRLRLAAARRMSLPRLQAGDTGWSVTLTAQGFTVGGVKYRAYSTTRTLRPPANR
jgi:hypothetical protein